MNAHMKGMIMPTVVIGLTQRIEVITSAEGTSVLNMISKDIRPAGPL